MAIGLALSIGVFNSLRELLPDWSVTTWAVVGASTLLGVVAVLSILLRNGRQELRRIEAGRERVRVAERNLEAALRTGHAAGSETVAAARSISQRVVLVPQQAEPEDDETGSQPPSRTEPPGSGSGRDQTSEQRPAEDDDGTPPAQPLLTLAELWTVTHSRLDLYHEIATGQARRSFRNAQAAMIIGFLLLIVFVAVALQASTTAGSVVAGGLGAVSAALSGFVARTFVKSQETAAAHLRAYFDQPLEFSRYLAAERLVADSALSEEQRAEVVTALVQAMVTPPSTPLAPGQMAGVPGQAGQQ